MPVCDHGLTQVNTVWVDHWDLEPDRLVEDDAYALWFGARVLAILQREYGADEPRNWWSRYNTASPEPRAAYEEALEPWLVAALENRR